MALLEIDAVAVSVPGRVLLRDLSLDLAGGELVGLTGPSGSGKTELLRCVAGLRDADSGSLRLGGRALGDWSAPEWRRRVTYVAQRAVLLEGSVRDNLLRPFRYKTVLAKPDEGKLLELLELLGLHSDVMGQEARTLSVGEQQRVGLVRALGIAPDVLLLDEPTSALDADAVARVEKLVRERAEDGIAAIIVSHDSAQTRRWTSRQIDVLDHA